jgi:hypothetical protein
MDPLRRNEKILRPMRDITQDSLSEAGALRSVHATASPESTYLPVNRSSFGMALAQEPGG